MEIIINGEIHQVVEKTTLSELLAQINLTVQGSAIAINQTIIPRSQWNKFLLSCGDNIVIIQATAGG